MADEKLANEGGEVDLILGAEIFYDLLCSGQHRLGIGLPIIQNTRLGWVVSGSVHVAADRKPETVRCNFTQTNILHFLDCDNITAKIPDDITQVFCNYSLTSDGNFVVTVPLKEPITAFGQSKPIVYKRFKSLET